MRISRVQLEGHVLLKIIAHSESCLPTTGTGSLLGLELDGCLHVTASFPFLPRGDEVNTAKTQKEKEQRAAELEQEERDYQYEMMKQLREVNVDSNSVGWYCSAWLECDLNILAIETHYEYQKDLGDNCVGIIYDPLKTTHGQVCVKAFRLTSAFIEMYRVGDFTHEALREKKLTSADILEEVPIVVRCNPLVEVFLSELGHNRELFSPATDESIELDITGYLTKSLEGLVDGADDLQQAITRYNQEQKRWKQAELYGGADVKPPKPNRLEVMLISKQLVQHCEHLNSVTMGNFENLYFSETLHKASDRISDAQ
jgi:translation initiation factor 3 subunit H